MPAVMTVLTYTTPKFIRVKNTRLVLLNYAIQVRAGRCRGRVAPLTVVSDMVWLCFHQVVILIYLCVGIVKEKGYQSRDLAVGSITLKVKGAAQVRGQSACHGGVAPSPRVLTRAGGRVCVSWLDVVSTWTRPKRMPLWCGIVTTASSHPLNRTPCLSPPTWRSRAARRAARARERTPPPRVATHPVRLLPCSPRAGLAVY